MLAQVGLNLDSGDILAAHLEHVLETAIEDEIALFGPDVEIASVEPPLCIQGGRSLLGILVVARHYAVTTYPYLACLTHPSLVAGLWINQTHLHAWVNLA